MGTTETAAATERAAAANRARDLRTVEPVGGRPECQFAAVDFASGDWYRMPYGPRSTWQNENTSLG